jgi:ABC-type antimicrobial peptide transport system permease subunit
MSETFFSVNDLLRRKFQTGLAIFGLSLCAGSTVFLLLFADRLGFGVSLRVEGSLTLGLSSILSNFFVFTTLLVFLVGAVVSSFLSFVMMAQRAKDIGLIRAAGCPSNVLFGYFFNELIIITLTSCLLGTVFGIAADFASTGLFNAIGLQVAQKTPNFWLALIVFAVFFTFALIFGVKPILDATKITPAEALSPEYYLHLTKETVSRVIPKSGLTFRMAVRNLSRYMSVTLRVVLCLIIVFVLATVAITGGIMAQQTTTNWIASALSNDAILVAHRDMCTQYALLLSEFRGPQVLPSLNYTAENYLVPLVMLLQLNQMQGITGIDSRFIFMQNITEVSANVYDNDTQSTVTVGDSRKGEALVVGVEPDSLTVHWFMQGEFLKEDSLGSVVIGDSLALKMFSQPLVQSIMFSNASFHVSGVCVDPINNGKVIYIHMKALASFCGVSGSNILLIRLDPSADRSVVLNRLKSVVAVLNGNFEVLELRETVEKNVGFLGYVWSMVATTPLFASVAAAFCLADYVALTTSQQKEEFGILRAVGARPKTILKILVAQNVIVLVSSFGAGLAVGLMFSLLFLIQKPFVSTYGLLEIFAGMISVLAVVFAFSLYPSFRLSRKPTLELIRES